ncbi:MAG TPA: GNAT family N-acetyltransferase, partial [Candidatus Polarisedimenticolia bacterium]|nr:GNAT family N-acetyltransferase [Candidatus Polarisedimenticolia bacterium]
PAGYTHPGYAASLGEFGSPRALEGSGGFLLERAIPGDDARDAMGCYPLFSCLDWPRLGDDLAALEGRLVSLAAVIDPFAPGDADGLRALFPDRVLPFKEHFVADLTTHDLGALSRHHRYYARRALARCEVEVAADPSRHLDAWTDLYSTLCSRHALTGIKAFSRAAFEKQLRVPGLVLLLARHEGETVGAHLWYEMGEVAYSHLAAASEKGYDLMVLYALYFRACEHFRGRVRFVDFGAGAGLGAPGGDGGNGEDGLARFKRGWANASRTAYFCGRVLDRTRYAKILAARGLGEEGYFPAYRRGEFA